MTNHLWQSTLFALVAGLLTCAFRKNRAQVRYWLWFSASVKFLVPFWLLMSLGSHLERMPTRANVGGTAVTQFASDTLLQFSQPFPMLRRTAPVRARAIDWTRVATLAWLGGIAFIALLRFRGWRRIRAAVRASATLDVPGTGVPVRSSAGLLEPGVVGVFRPLLLLPAGIVEELTPSQFQAVIAHELCHVRRRDNLTAAIHMIVEAVFWFHPLVWWIGARLLEERERACDEEVLRLGGDPQVYAEGILKVCKNYLESPLSCVSGATGADFKKRIQIILSGRVPMGMGFVKKSVLAAVGILALAAPVIVGVMDAPAVRAQSGDGPKFAVAYVNPCSAGSAIPGGRGGGGPLISTLVPVDATGNFVIPNIPPAGRLDVSCDTVANLIHIAYGLFANGRLNLSLFRPGAVPIEGGPAWVSSDKYRIDAIPAVAASGAMMQGSMLQGLLEDKFKLKIYRETREVSGYALVVASGGPKLPRFKEGTCIPVKWDQFRAAAARVRFSGRIFEPSFTDFSKYCPNRGGGLSKVVIDAQGISVDNFVETFLITDRPVIDKTGIKGLFDFHLEFAPEKSTNSADNGPSIFTALEEQLGLKLEPSRVPQDVLVIDRIERPSTN